MDPANYEALKAERDALAEALRAMVALGEWEKGRAHISVSYFEQQNAAFALARETLAKVSGKGA